MLDKIFEKIEESYFNPKFFELWGNGSIYRALKVDRFIKGFGRMIDNSLGRLDNYMESEEALDFSNKEELRKMAMRKNHFNYKNFKHQFHRTCLAETASMPLFCALTYCSYHGFQNSNPFAAVTSVMAFFNLVNALNARYTRVRLTKVFSRRGYNLEEDEEIEEAVEEYNDDYY